MLGALEVDPVSPMQEASQGSIPAPRQGPAALVPQSDLGCTCWLSRPWGNVSTFFGFEWHLSQIKFLL